MSGRASRTKGKIGEAAAKRLLMERGYEVMGRPRGETGDDFMAVLNGKCYSVEVKHTQSLEHVHFDQCKDNAGTKPRLLMWRPSKWGLPARVWLVFSWPPGNVSVWRAN